MPKETTKLPQIICLIGMMGAGKTTIGNKIANKIGYYFIDSDQEIEDVEAMTINQIFSNKGEKYFRNIEEKIILQILDREEEKIVLSLGGGAFINDKIRAELKNKSLTIWLNVDIEKIITRVSKKNNRPLLSGKESKRKIITDLLRKREPIYRQADLIFDNNKSCDHLADEIINKIKEISINNNEY